MANPMLAELDAVVRLMDAAPDCGWCDGSGEEEDDSSVGCGDRSCCSPAMTSCGECFGTGKRQGKVLNSSVFAFLRTHHATLADMAKRLEAAERDAARYRFIRDKQATIIYKRKGHGVWEPLIDTRETSTRCASLDEAVDAAIDAATQEGEG